MPLIVGVRILIATLKKYLFRSLLTKKFLGLVPRIFFYLFTFHCSLFSPLDKLIKKCYNYSVELCLAPL